MLSFSTLQEVQLSSNNGFTPDRWKAARCLQEQMDATQGVEYTRRLAKSRAINARHARRAIMVDVQG